MQDVQSNIKISDRADFIATAPLHVVRMDNLELRFVVNNANE